MRVHAAGRAAMAVALAAAAGLAQGGVAPAAHAAGGCDPVWTDPTGDAYQELPYAGAPLVTVGLYQPQLDLVSGTAWRSGGNLVLRVHVADMEAQFPAGHTAESWNTSWTVGGTTLYAWAVVTEEGSAYGFSLGTAGSQAATGSTVDGPDGYVEIDVPLSALGSPAAGTTVGFDGADAWEWTAAVVDPLGVNLQPVVSFNNGGAGPFFVGDVIDDAPGGGTTTIGATCP